MDQGNVLTKYVLKLQLKIPPQFIRPICPNWIIIWHVFEKKPNHMSTVYVLTHLLPAILKICMGPHFITKCTKIEKKNPLLIFLIHRYNLGSDGLWSF